MVITTAIIIFAICLIYIFKDPHKFILSYSVGSILLQGWLCVRFEPPALTVSFMVNLVLTMFFFLHRKRYPLKDNPLKTCIVLFILMKLISFMSSGNMISSAPAFLVTLCQIPPIIMLYHEVKSNEDINWIVKSIVVVFLILSVYAVIEYFLQINPIFTYLVITVPQDILYGKIFYYGMNITGDFATRFGSVRCSSLMPIHITLGTVSVLFFALMMFFRDRLLSLMKEGIWWVFIVLSVFCLFITGSRAPYVFFIIVAFPFFMKDMSMKIRILGLIGGIMAVLVFGEIFDEIVKSITDTESVSGSNVAMRQNQYKAVLKVIQNDFLFGLGTKGYADAVMKNPSILGAESVWFQTLISGGLVGVILLTLIYISMLKTMIINSPRIKVFSASFFVLGYIFLVSATTVPGLDIVYVFGLLTILIKYWRVEVIN